MPADKPDRKRKEKRNFAGKGKNGANKKHFGRNGGKKGHALKRVSRTDKEIKEIAELESRITELQSKPEEELKKIKRFEDLPLSNYTKAGLRESGFTEMTDIQQAVLVSALSGRDILGCAKTGSGKTLAFLIPALELLYRQRWDQSDGLGVVILSPIRELAIQIFDVLRTIGKYHSFSAGLVIGGKDFEEEQLRIHDMNILVATPGRFLQHLEQTADFNYSNTQMVVVDEMDRCLDLGFKTSVERICEDLGEDRQGLMFSATVDAKVKGIANTLLREAVYVNVSEEDDYATPSTIMQRYVVCPLKEKIELLFSFIKSHLKCRILVFMNSRKEVRFLYEAFSLMKPGIPLMHIHGKQKQTMRTYTYYDFLQREASCMFCTDIAARGLDFPNIDWVVQWDCPEDGESYIHRVGRAGRYRSTGNALLFLLPSEERGFLELMAEARVPLKKILVNPSKTQSITNRLMEEVAQDGALRQLAVGAFRSYLRSVHLAANKAIFDVQALPLEAFAESLGLGIVPKVSFKEKKKEVNYQMAQLEKEMEKEEVKEKKEEEESEEEFLVKTGKTTVDLEGAEELPKRKEKRRIDRENGTAKKIRFDEDGNRVETKEEKVESIDEVNEEEFNAEKIDTRIMRANEDLKKKEAEIKEREKGRVREKKLQKKIKEKEEFQSHIETPTVVLGNEDNTMEED